MAGGSQHPADPADRGQESQVPRTVPDLVWYQVADALWLASRIADLPAGSRGVDHEREPASSAIGAGDHPASPAPVEAPEPSAEPLPTEDVWEVSLPSPIGVSPNPQVEPEGTPVRGRPTGPALRDSSGLARVLRGLKQHLPSRRDWVLNETATAERAADDPRWLPVLEPADELRWEVAVVIDDHLSMAVWQHAVFEFVALLRRQGAFRDVGVWMLNSDVKDPADLVLNGPGPDALPARPARLLTATGRRIVLVLTDGLGPAWEVGAASAVLRMWAGRMPVAIVHLLPQERWHRGGVRPLRVRMRAPLPGVANALYFWETPDAILEPTDTWGRPLDHPVPVPVLELRPRWLAAWARLVIGNQVGSTTLPAVLAARWRPPADGRSGEAPRPDPRQLVADFTSGASPAALQLATQLAAAPLNLPVMHALQRELLPTSDASHLSEIINSGLLRPVVPATQIGDAERVTFDFDRGVREELLAVGRRTDTVRVVRLVSERLGPRVPAVRALSRVLDDPDTAPEPAVTPETVPYIRVEQAVLRALSGRYLARSRLLEARLPPDPADTPPGPSGAAGRAPVTIEPPSVIDEQPTISSGGSGVSSSAVQETTTRPVVPLRTPGRAPVIWGNVPPQNPNFTGREELLVQLHERVRGGTTAVLPQALHGMGGVGKSQLAVEYVYRHLGDYDLIWWISAERSAQIEDALVQLAQRMDLPVGRDANVAVPAVMEALRRGTPYANWLLIFDNAEDPEVVRNYFPMGAPGSILVTSRNQQWEQAARSLEVDVFEREESIALLRRRRPDLSEKPAGSVAQALGDLPLAIEQAAAWLAETGMSAEEYLRLFNEERARTELLDVSPPLDYPATVAAAWNVSLSRLVSSNPAAQRLLQVCAFFAPEPIARTLIAGVHIAEIHPELNATLRNPMMVNRAIRDIGRYALARINHRTNSIQMHRLVQTVLIDRMNEAERTAMRHSAHLLLAASDRNDPVDPENWGKYGELYPHLMASGMIRSADSQVQQTVENEARYLYWWGAHEAARDLSQRAYDAWAELLGPTAFPTLSIGRWLGFMLFVVGRFKDARDFNSRLLEAHQSVFAEDTEELLAAEGAVAADRRVAGDFAGALEIDEDLYQRHVRAFGVDEPATLNAAHNLAVSVRLCGDLQRAFELDSDTRARLAQLFGNDHVTTLESTRNLITDRRELGEYVQARAEAQDVADLLRQQLRPGHPQTLRALRSLSVAIRKSGDHPAARALSDEVYTGFVTRYGENHPDSVAAALNLSIDMRETGELDASAELGAQVCERYRLLLDERHPHTVAASLNLAVTHRVRGDVALARRLNGQGRAALVERLGADHPHTLAATVNLASDLYADAEFAAAHDRDIDTAERLRRVLGGRHPTTLACLANLAMDLQALGRQAEAIELHADTMAKFREALGEGHPATVAAANLTIRANVDLDPMPL
jgi:tetratricopeptide (TPR) repeat protein